MPVDSARNLIGGTWFAATRGVRAGMQEQAADDSGCGELEVSWMEAVTEHVSDPEMAPEAAEASGSV